MSIKRDKNINWQNVEVRNEYEAKLITNLRKIKINMIWKAEDDAEERIEQCYKNVLECFINTHNEMLKERHKEGNNRDRKNNWWTRELSEL